MTAAVVGANSSITSWWYGQNRAADTTRRLESVLALNPSPGPVGAVTVRQGELTAAFLTGLSTPLPHPWQPAGRQASIAWEAVDPGSAPDPEHPVYLVVLGTGENPSALFVLNLAAFSRIRVLGDSSTAGGIVNRWVLELLSTHPGTTIGITDDVWPGPFTSRVRQVSAGNVPDVDVLFLGAGYSYADRSQIVSSSTSRIVIDLGQDAAVSATWTLTCGADLQGELSNGSERTMKATLIGLSPNSLDLWRGLMDPGRPAPQQPADHVEGAETTGTAVPPPWDTESDDAFDFPANDDMAEWTAPPSPEDLLFGQESDHSTSIGTDDDSDVDPHIEESAATVPAAQEPQTPLPVTPIVSAPPATDNSADMLIGADDGDEGPSESTGAGSSEAAEDLPGPPAAAGSDHGSASTPTISVNTTAVPARLAVIWNRILGPVTLCPPHGGPEHPRDKRLNELTVFLQTQRNVKRSEIVDAIFSGVAEEQTVTGQLSILRKRLGRVRPDGDVAFPTLAGSYYRLHRQVISDWMEFDRLIGIDPDHTAQTAPADLIAAMELVTGAPLDGIKDTEWSWSKFLRDDMKTRVPNGALALAKRYFDNHDYSAALGVARKGLWYDSARNDLWAVALRSAAADRQDDTFRELRSDYIAKVPEAERNSEVFDLT